MGTLALFSRIDINEKIADALTHEDCVIVDVRPRENYVRGHIKNSINVPFAQLRNFAELVPDNATPLFVYCESGWTSRRAVRRLRRMGYNATDCGGIRDWLGSRIVGER